MVSTRRSSRGQVPATTSSAPTPSPSPTRRSTRASSRSSTPTKDESPSTTEDAPSADGAIEDVTPSKRRTSIGSKRASPATRAKKITPVKEDKAGKTKLVVTPVSAEKSANSATILISDDSDDNLPLSVTMKSRTRSTKGHESKAVEADAIHLDASHEAPEETAHENEVIHLDASDEAPEASDEAPEASDGAPEVSDVAPEVSDDAPEASDEAPDASDDGEAAAQDEDVIRMESTEDEEEEMQVVDNGEEETGMTLDDDDDDDDEDMDAMVELALTSFRKQPAVDDGADEDKPRTLVANRLDSGVGATNLYLDFKGKKCAKGAQLAAERKLVEELKWFAKSEKTAAEQDRVNGKAHAKATESGKNMTSNKWFNMVSNEMTAEAKRDIQLIKMRNYIDPKRFYKSSDHRKSSMPKVFQVGTVIEGAAEFKSARLSRKDRQQTFTEEIMHDQQIRNYTKRKFNDIQASKANHNKKAFKTAKHQKHRK
ncbi:Aste57867_2345 [Aphanomyces stellatus]|uniref:Aste57867_2345 protein n=1 Tax=Aphanomyces stellatus TaxID=120398 RepID=A0A485KB34_9STRA|nr:hypothetical protein As57867_002340 [Aphanomyces stellatus]VFT79546.1 Aste57867_2345 [Aphanomyces stellatus]